MSAAALCHEQCCAQMSGQNPIFRSSIVRRKYQLTRKNLTELFVTLRPESLRDTYIYIYIYTYIYIYDRLLQQNSKKKERERIFSASSLQNESPLL